MITSSSSVCFLLFQRAFFLRSWSDLLICHSRLQLLSSSHALGHGTGATLKQRKRQGKRFLSVILLPENVHERAMVSILPEPRKKEKKNTNLKENVWNENVRTECWSLSLIPRQSVGALPLTWAGVERDPQVSWYSPRIRNFWQKIHTAIEFPLENWFSLHTTIYGVRLHTKTAGTYFSKII